MSRFTRSGHYRTNSNGTTFWVSGHTVDRYDWDRYSYYSPPPPPPPPPTQPSPPRAAAPPPSFPDGRNASFTIPNATCPVCGAQVFFYQNEYGSRVFFDDLGPPWPKHPCTDNEPDPIGRPGVSVGQSIPVAKGPGISVVIRRLASDALVEESEVDDDYSPPLRTGHGWDRCVVRKRSDREGLAYFVVYNASDPANRSIRFSTSSRPDLPSSEETLYLSGNRMSFFSFADFVPQEVSIERKSTKAVSSSKKRAARRRKARRKRK